MAAKDDREFDVVIFGGTGYTGRYVIEELANSTRNFTLKWAVAGRNIQKLKSSLQSVQNYLKDINILNTTTIQADVDNEDSILNMCKRAKLILNCVGPYKLYGEVVVSSCIKSGTHHVDISGEFKYLETVQANYFNAARDKGIYIVQACGFDSIPADYGLTLLGKKFPGDLNSVEYYAEIKYGPEGATANSGTFISAAESITDMLHLGEYDKLLRANVFKKKMIQNKYPLPKRWPLFYSNIVKGWCVWFTGPDERVVKRSQMFRYEFLNEKPIQFNPYAKMSSLAALFYFIFFGSIFIFLSLFSFGRYLLSKYPSFFSAGTFTGSGPTRKQVEDASTTVTLIGEGWKDKLANLVEEHGTKPDTKMKLTMTGPEPAYALTSITMVQAGLTILQEKDKLPLEGGVLTPGIAFENTTLSERLQKRGVVFAFENVY